MLARRCQGLLVPRRGRVLNEASVQVQVPRVPRHLQDVHTRESKWEKPLEIASEGERGVMRAREEKRKGPAWRTAAAREPPPQLLSLLVMLGPLQQMEEEKPDGREGAAT